MRTGQPQLDYPWLYDWLPTEHVAPDVLRAARARALADGVPATVVLQGSAPDALLVLDTKRRPAAQRFLAASQPRQGVENARQAARVTLRLLAPPEAPAVLLVTVEPREDLDQTRRFWLALDLADPLAQACAVVMVRDRRFAVTDRAPVPRTPPPAVLLGGDGGIAGATPALLARHLPALVPPARFAYLPSAVAQAIWDRGAEAPLRVVYGASSRGRLVVYARPQVVRDRRREADPYFVAFLDRAGSLEEGMLPRGWRSISLAALGYAEPGRATLQTEVVVAWAGPANDPWPGLLDALREAQRQPTESVLLSAYFLAQTAALPEPDRLAWLPSFDALAGALPHLPSDVDLAQRDGARALMEVRQRAKRLWREDAALVAAWALGPHPAPAGRDAPEDAPAPEVAERFTPEAFRAVTLLATSARWSSQPPAPHAAQPDLSVNARAAIAFAQHLALHAPGTPPLPPLVQRWQDEAAAAPWAPWQLGQDDVPLGEEALDVLRQAVLPMLEALADAPILVGHYAPTLPPGHVELDAAGVAAVWVYAQEDGWRWVRVVPRGGRGGLVLPWRPAAVPPSAWRLLLRTDIRVDLHLFLLGYEYDMRREHRDAVFFVAAGGRVAPRSPGGPARVPAAPGRGHKTVRARPERVHLLPDTPLAGDYVSADERAEIARQLAEQHPVTPHVVRYVVAQRTMSADKRAIWERLTDAQRLRYFRRTRLGPDETIRGVRDVGGHLVFGYQRGVTAPDRPPTVVRAAGALISATASRLIREAQADALRAGAVQAQADPLGSGGALADD